MSCFFKKDTCRPIELENNCVIRGGRTLGTVHVCDGCLSALSMKELENIIKESKLSK